ncbi:lipopolysaccharide biosynthesis protein [Haladaptatus sp. GCM10025707]|uniref:lipopolysaccharide biosynthesis protein n=1 Tax=unclassified Haladaptatus TaxID=2622732 RepID=UPI0023E8A3B4|nr:MULTISPECIES: lipopolysaccharide biosynthesis protein [unclassified Haladaptatus]
MRVPGGGLFRRLLPGGSLADRTIKSGIWVTISNITDRGLQLLLLVILARLLAPADFGLMGIALLTATALRRLSNLGLNQALIYQKGDDVDHYLNTAWSMEVARGLLLAAVTFAIAPLVADLFHEPRALPVLQVVAISPLLTGIRNPGVIYFQKNLEFHKQLVYQLSGSFTNFIVAVTIAVIYGSVWALVLGYVLADAARLVVSYLAHEFRPGLSFDLSAARELFTYGKWVTGGGIVTFLYSQGDDAVVGWLLNATSLGFYQVAYQFAMAPATEIAAVISSVAFPSYSKLQDDVPALREAFFQTVQVSTAVSFPLAVGIVAVAPTFVVAFLGETWEPTIVPIQLIGVYAFLISMTMTFAPVWQARGHPDYGTKVSALRTVFLAIVIIPATLQYGIVGTAAAVVATYVVPSVPIDIYLLVRTVETTYGRFVREITYPLVASLLMGGAVWATQLLVTVNPLVEFVLLVIVGAGVYGAVVFVLTTRFGWSLGRNIRTIGAVVRG